MWSALPVWAQTESSPVQQPVPAMVGVNNSTAPAETYNPDTSGDRMVTPPPVSGQAYPVMLTSEGRSNYLQLGLVFTGAYSDNVLGSAAGGKPVSDQSYSIGPMISLDETTPRMHTVLSYAPGFTFYQHTSSRNEADHNASIEFEYRLSPHVTFSATDSFQKSSNVFNQPARSFRGSGFRRGSRSEFLDHCSNCGSAQQFRQCWTELSVRIERHDRGERKFFKSALSKSGPSARSVRHEFTRRPGVLLPPSG